MENIFISVNHLLPFSEPGKWSRDLVVRTNKGNIYTCSMIGGYWQRLFCFEKDEKITGWIERDSFNEIDFVKIKTPFGERVMVGEYEDLVEVIRKDNNGFDYFYKKDCKL